MAEMNAGRAADGNDFIADHKSVGIADFHRDKVKTGRIDFNYGNVRKLIRTDKCCFHLRVIAQIYGDFVRALHDVVVGDDVAVRAVDKAGTRTLRDLRL